MIHWYRFKNFFSFRNETEISFEVGKRIAVDDLTALSPAGERLTKALAVIGPNASGKTTALKPLAFLQWFVCDSFQEKPEEKIFVVRHALAQESASEIALCFDVYDRLFRYELSVTPERVVSESLYEKTSKFFSYRFKREWDEGEQRYRIQQNKFGFNQREAEKVRSNASLIATAVQYEVPLALTIASYIDSFIGNITSLGRAHFRTDNITAAARFFQEWPDLESTATHLLSQWDLGLTDVTLRKIKMLDKEGNETERLIPFGIHSVGDSKFELPLNMESSGTQSAYVLLSRILPTLELGGIAIIDELESDLHPHMLAPLLDLFFNEETNPHNAQIIFTCHSMEILNLLKKWQVVLVEKNPETYSSEAWRLDEMQGVRNDENLYAKYMAGAYGATPRL